MHSWISKTEYSGQPWKVFSMYLGGNRHLVPLNFSGRHVGKATLRALLHLLYIRKEGKATTQSDYLTPK